MGFHDNMSFNNHESLKKKISKNFVHGTKYQRSSFYFSDNCRCIDFVLAYEPDQIDLFKDEDKDLEVNF